jgi:putative hydroxymethylpyrimidine transport system substrate-binding protein
MSRPVTPAGNRSRLTRAALGLIALALSVLLPADPAKAEKLTLLLDWFLNPDHAPLVVAEEMGFFAAAGLEVEMIEPADPNDPPKLVAAGKADLAVSLIATPLNTLLVLDDSPIRGIADLKGRSVGFSVGGFEDALLAAMLAPHGLGLDDIKLINVNFSLSPSLLSGQVDAVIGAFRNFELNQLAIEGYKGRAFYVEEEGVPAYDELILVAHRDRLEDPRIDAFLSAVERAVQYLVNHPEESWGLFVRHRKDLDDELNRRAWRDTLPRFALRPRALDSARYAAFAAFLLDQGVIETSPPPETYAVEIR